MKVTTRKGKAYLKADGKMTVIQAAEFKDALLASLKKADEIEINLNEVETIDLSCLQLMCSAHLSAAKDGKSLRIKDPSASAFLEARENAGFTYSKPCRFVSTGDCLWIYEGDE